MALAVTDSERELVTGILNHIAPHAVCLAFGSRINASHKPYSDLDLALDAGSPLSLATLSALEEAFSLSDLPYKVDLIDLHRVSPEFKQLVATKHERISA